GDRQVSGCEAVAKVNRKDFNIIWNRNLDQGGTLLGDEVEIHLNIEAGTPPPAEKKEEAGAAKWRLGGAAWGNLRPRRPSDSDRAGSQLAREVREDQEVPLDERKDVQIVRRDPPELGAFEGTRRAAARFAEVEVDADA